MEKNSLKNVPLVIFCGGKATRMQNAYGEIPKPLIRIWGLPIVCRIIEHYKTHGVTKFILLTGSSHQIFIDSFRNLDFRTSLLWSSQDISNTSSNKYDFTGLDIRCIYTGDDTNTGDRLRLAKSYIQGDNFFLTYGDGLSNVDIKLLYESHISGGKLITLTLVPYPPRFGIVKIGKDYNNYVSVESFAEKDRDELNLINGGFMVCSTNILNNEDINNKVDGSFENDFIGVNSLIGLVGGFKHYGSWSCVDTQRDVENLNRSYTNENINIW
jgi:glucose-1-phosphate cytidylyltransferase